MDEIDPNLNPCPAPRAPERPTHVRIAPDRLRRTGLLAAAIVVGLAAGAPLAGCSMFAPPPPPPPKPPPPPPKLALRIAAAGKLNPDATGRPSPVVVRIYELKSPAIFSSADFMTLYDQDRSVLASDIVVRDEIVLRPGDTRAIDRLLAPETQAIAVTAAFRDLDRAKWRAVAMVAPGKDNTFRIGLEDVVVTIEGGAK